MSWVLLLMLHASDQRLLPVQADLTGIAGLGERSAAGVGLYVGAAGGLARSWGMPFAGLGFEFTQAAGFSPFRTSYGLQLRAGWAWTRDDPKPKELMPDVMVFLRVTPFIGSSSGIGDAQLPPGVQYARGPDGLFGLRVGVGLTSPWWTATLLFHRPFGSEHTHVGDLVNVFTTLLLAPFALINHVEVVGELVGLTGASTLTVRLGCGF